MIDIIDISRFVDIINFDNFDNFDNLENYDNFDNSDIFDLAFECRLHQNASLKAIKASAFNFSSARLEADSRLMEL